jgi:hypothetical protein
MSGHTMDELPGWPVSTASVLATVDADGAPHAIPVSTARRAGPRRILFALAPSRGSYARLEANARAAMLVMAPEVAFSAEGTVRVIAEPLDPDGRVHGLELVVETIWDHNGPTFGMDDGVRWHWTEEDAKRGDDAAHAELERLT